MPNKTKKKKCMELDFREVEFQNAAIRLKNTTIGLLEPGMGSHKIFFAGKRHYRILKHHYKA